MQDLNAIAQATNFTLTAARAINTSGVIAGWGTTNGALQAFQLNGTNLTVIPLLSGATNGYASAVNSNSIVGACGTTNGLRTFLWQGGNLYDLNDRIATNSGWVLREANGINGAGQIVGWGNINGEVHAFLLTPNQAPTVSITSPSNNTTNAAPVDLTITATASDDVAVARVDFYVGTKLIGSSTTVPYTATWLDVCVGAYALSAVAYDNLGISTTSAVVNVIVTLPAAANLKCWLKPESLNLNNGAGVSLLARQQRLWQRSFRWGSHLPHKQTQRIAHGKVQRHQ